jgi:hypothetical protein
MPYYDEYGSGWDQTSPNVARTLAAMQDGFQPGAPPAGSRPGDISEAGGMQAHDPDLMDRIWAWLQRQFGGGQGQPGGSIQSSQLAPPPGSQAMDPGSPFGGTPYDQPQAPPPTKPATKLSSGTDIGNMIRGMMSPRLPDFSGNGAPSLMSPGDFSIPGYTRDDPQGYAAPMDYFNMGAPPPPKARVDLRDQGSSSKPLRDQGFNPFNQPYSGLRNSNQWQPPYNLPQPLPPYERPYASGGDVPGFMRGGYPQLYNAPVRHFDSGGENYVNTGSGSKGRADDVNARLSEKEYVLTSEDMALLGDGNPDAGAKEMDQWRVNLRKHKGKALAKGKISPNAKPASAYVAGNPMGDGIRRAGAKQ